MEQPNTWEALLVGIIAIALIFLFRPGIKKAFEQSKAAEKDWKSVLIPIAAVVLFVILLISLV